MAGLPGFPRLLNKVLQALSGTPNKVYLGQMPGVQALAAFSSFSPCCSKQPIRRVGVALWPFGTRQLRMRRPVLNTHQTMARQAAMKTSVMVTLTPMCTSAWP